MSTPGSAADEQETTEQLLRSREAKGLIWSVYARLAFVTAITVVTLLGIIAAWPALIVTLCVAGGALSIYCLYLARRLKHLRFIGLAGVLYDLVFLAMVPLLWYRIYGGPDVPPAYLMKLPLILPILMFMVINTMALQPLYPAIFAGGSFFLYLSTAAYVLLDPRVETNNNLLEVATGPAVSVNQIIMHTMVLVLVGVFLTLLSRAARGIVHDVVELEAKNRKIVKEQARLIMEVKMAGMANLVAGIAHEINTPLGATMSSADMVEVCSSTIGGAIESADDTAALKKDRKLNRGLTVLKDSSQIIKKSGDRIAGVVSSLKDFSRLDQAEVQQTDIRSGLDSTLALITPDTKGNAQIVKEYGSIPEIECRPKELNQVFMTLIMNAFEAMSGDGTLRVGALSDNDAVTIEISDTGKGIPQEQLETLFEIGFGEKTARVGMGLGLPTAKGIIDRHDGSLSVESKVGQGTTFRISLPARAASAAS
jgi:signal transduction histidine kinase